MGLFSDYLEDCRDSICSNEVDPCLFINTSALKSNLYFHSVYKPENIKYLESDDISAHLNELERIKANYLIAERILLKYKNANVISSVLVNDVFTFIYNQLHQSYISICEIINNIKKNSVQNETDIINSDSDEMISSDLFNSIISGILFCLKSGSAIDTSECRKAVNDTANLICFFTKENYSFSKKQIFQYYLENVIKIPKSQCLCSNCRKTLFFEIPYCFNCYERN